ncbi:hypothetical protein JGI22_00218 [Candidatus Kryptobacter tengchongensis]|nr:hypothetical protein JGI22_00218 [Candidatus Kryptobacter tengchongensis]
MVWRNLKSITQDFILFVLFTYADAKNVAMQIGKVFGHHSVLKSRRDDH